MPAEPFCLAAGGVELQVVEETERGHEHRPAVHSPWAPTGIIHGVVSPRHTNTHQPGGHQPGGHPPRVEWRDVLWSCFV